MEDRIRVLFFIESLAGGGAEKVLSIVADHIDKSRFDVTVCTVTEGGAHADEVGRAVKLRSLVGGARGLWYKVLYNLIYYVLPPGLVYRLLVPRGSDVEVAFCEGFATRLLARSPVKRKIALIHTDLEANPWTQVAAYRSLDEERRAYTRYTERVCVSESVRESFEKRFSLPARTAYNPIDTDAIIRRSRERVGLPPKTRIRFVTSGRLVAQKGYDRLLHTAARLRDAGADFELWILGDGMQMETLCDYIEAMDLEDRVTMWGYVANPYPLVASADVFVCSSRSEGYSTAATEAIILGVPVVTTLCAGMRELLGDGRYGIIVDNEDDALYEPLKKITEDPAFVADLRRRARTRSRDFALPAMMAPIEELLNPTQKSR